MSDSERGGCNVRRSLRHSVVAAIPDGSIAALYPVDDNYVNEGNGKRSPKSLAELATEALCRSLPLLNGELPPGLPQDVVDDVINSLITHSALNATTLRVLRNCELRKMSLAGCRGVSDEWLEPLSRSNSTSLPPSPGFGPLIPRGRSFGVEPMDLDDDDEDGCEDHRKPCDDIFYGTFDTANATNGSGGSSRRQLPQQDHEESSCSTSSFVSATSTPFYADAASSSEDHAMADVGATPSSDRLKFASSHQSEMMMSILEPPSLMWTPSVTANITLLDLRGSQRLTDKGLLLLTDLAALEVAKLDNCHGLVGRGLLAFSSSHRLRTLSLANCRRLTDEAVINISHLLGVEALSLDGCRCLTDRSLAALADMYGLRRLGLSQCDLITDSGLEQLENLEGLEELSLGWCRQVSDQGIDSLTLHHGRKSNLRILRLARCPITDVGVEYLTRLSALEELDLNGCSGVGSSALGKTLRELTHLATLDVSYCPGILRSGFQGKIAGVKTLELCYSGVKDSHLGKLTDLPKLEELNLDSCPVGDWAISHFADNNVVPNLKSLDLADTDLTDIGMAKIAKFEKLTRLSLFYCNITNGGLRHIAKLKLLEVLNLDSREISDDGLRYLKNLENLKSLDIFSGRITDSGCSHIASIASLESLELCGGGVGDPGCTVLATLENLTSLNLSQNERITNRGAAALAALSNLKALNLSNTRVNSSALRFFGGLVKLQSLALYGCRGIEDSERIDKLQDDLPNLKCLRLNRASDDDGVILTDTSSSADDDEDASSWSRSPQHAPSASENADIMVDIDVYSDHD